MTLVEILMSGIFDLLLSSAVTAYEARKAYNAHSFTENKQMNEMVTTPMKNLDGINF